LLLLACGAHAEGGAAGRVGKSGDARSREAEEGPATSAPQVFTVVPEHSEPGRVFVDPVQGDGAGRAVEVFRGARAREGDRSKKIGM